MRLTTAIWFGVFMRNESQRGAFVTAVKTGAQQAGAIFVIHNHLDGSFSLYGPAPQVFTMDDETSGDRVFEKVLDRVGQDDVDRYLEKQKNFDPDLWIVETESGEGTPNLVLADPL
ncbi:MAG: DUF1491 family protein [Rhizobiaceae bacterium]|nr:DUF1491 family protein [Rhizobiaceae bacterium]